MVYSQSHLSNPICVLSDNKSSELETHFVDVVIAVGPEPGTCLAMVPGS